MLYFVYIIIVTQKNISWLYMARYDNVSTIPYSDLNGIIIKAFSLHNTYYYTHNTHIMHTQMLTFQI